MHNALLCFALSALCTKNQLSYQDKTNVKMPLTIQGFRLEAEHTRDPTPPKATWSRPSPQGPAHHRGSNLPVEGDVVRGPGGLGVHVDLPPTGSPALACAGDLEGGPKTPKTCIAKSTSMTIAHNRAGHRQTVYWARRER